MSDRRAGEKVEEGPRPPPSNLEAEQALLGALLVNNEAIHLVATFLEPDHFFLPVHGRIYAAVLHMVGRREIANPVTLKTFFENDEALKEAGGGQYLARLAGSAVTVINAEHYGRTIHDLHVRRGLIGVAEDMRDVAYDAPLDQPPREQVERAEAKLHELLEGAPGTQSERRTIGDAASGAAASIEKAYKADGALLGLPVGITAVENRLGGLQAPDMIVVGGRPGMGKTGMALGVALAAAEAGHHILFASLEMSAEQLGKRALSILTGTSHYLLQQGQIEQHDFQAVYKASQRLKDMPLLIDDAGGQTPDYIERSARRLHRQGRLELLIVDHLQLMRSPRETRVQGRVHQITNFTMRMKALAKELDIPVLLLSQLSRAGERTDNKVPQLSDLRDSGSIEQDADTILFLFREAYYLAKEEPAEDDVIKHTEWQEMMARTRNKGDVFVAKNRHGPTMKITLRWVGETMSYRDLFSD